MFEGKMEEISIKTDFIKLDAFLKFCGEAGTGGEAKLMVAEEKVKVNGQTCTMRGKKLYGGDRVSAPGGEYMINSGE